jgi:hypothetical protein
MRVIRAIPLQAQNRAIPFQAQNQNRLLSSFHPSRLLGVIPHQHSAKTISASACRRRVVPQSHLSPGRQGEEGVVTPCGSLSFLSFPDYLP